MLHIGLKVKPKQDITINTRGDLLRPEYEYTIADVIVVQNNKVTLEFEEHVKLLERVNIPQYINANLFLRA